MLTKVVPAMAPEIIAEIQAAVDGLVNAAPGALDTLNELAASLGDDPAFATTITNALAGKQPLNSNLTAIAAVATQPFGRSLLAGLDAQAVRELIGSHDAANLLTGVIPDARLGYAVLNQPANSIAGDWNTFLSPGWQSGIIRGNVTNANGPPGSVYYHLYVLAYQGDQFVQYAHPYAGSVASLQSPVMRRARTSTGVWSAWHPVGAPSVGTATEEGGISAGAIIESGFNANGYYTKYADGTLICSVKLSVSAAINIAHYGGFRSGGQTWTFPVAFVDDNARVTTSPYYGEMFAAAPSTITTTDVVFVHLSVSTQSAANRTVHLQAIGRWF